MSETMNDVSSPKAAVADPSESAYRQARRLQRKGHWKKAHAAYTTAVAGRSGKDIPAEWLFGLGRAAEVLGKLEQARSAYSQALALKPDEAEWHFRAGLVEQAAGRTVEAEAAFRLAISHGSANPECYVHLSQVLKAQGRKSAFEYLKKSLPLFALRVSEGQHAMILPWGRVLLELGQLRSGLDAAVEAVTKLGGNAESVKFLGRMCEALGDEGEILHALERLRPLRQDPALSGPLRPLYLRLCVRFACFEQEAVAIAQAAILPECTDRALRRASVDLLHIVSGSSEELADLMELVYTEQAKPEDAELLQVALIWLRLKQYKRLGSLCERYPVLDGYAASHPAIAHAAVKLQRLPAGSPAHAEATAMLSAYESIQRAEKAVWKRVADRKLSLAIIGNSECEFGRGRGPEIDAHDLVIRFNSVVLGPPFDVDYGCKTDLHVRPSRDIKKYLNKGTKTTVISGIRMLDRAKAAQWALMRRLVEEGHQVATFPPGHQHELIMKLRRAPSAGLTTAWVASKLRAGGAHKTSYYGFSFLDQIGANAKSAHYFEKSAPSGRHGWDGEAVCFQEITGTKLESAAPPPAASGPRIRLLGDHAGYHAGSSAVVDYLHSEIAKVGTLVNGDDYDVLLINGEGSMHHDTGPFVKKMQALGEAQGLRRRSYLINTVWERNSNAYDGILKNLDGLVLRERMSQEDLRTRHGIEATACIDISFFADVDESADYVDLGGKMAIGDFYAEDFGCFVRLSGGPLSRHPFIDMRDMSWSSLVKTLRTSPLLVTGRHHAVFAACRARTPFVALQGNTHKIEGMIKLSGVKIPTCSKPQDLRRCMTWAGANRAAYDDLFAWMEAQPPFRLAELLAGSAKPAVVQPARPRRAR